MDWQGLLHEMGWDSLLRHGIAWGQIVLIALALGFAAEGPESGGVSG